MLIDSGLPKSFWAEACLCATHLTNIVPICEKTGKSPYEMIYKVKPKITHMNAFGSPCFFYTQKVPNDKWDERGIEGIMVGYTERVDGYRIYQPGTRKIRLTKNVVFVGKAQQCNAQVPGSGTADEVTLNLDAQRISDGNKSNEMPTPDEDEIPEEEPRVRDSATTDARSGAHDSTDSDSEPGDESSATIPPQEPRELRHKVTLRKPRRLIEEAYSAESSPVGPTTLAQALNSSEAVEWQKAMETELAQIASHKVWSLVEPPNNRKPLTMKWVFKIKTAGDNKILRYRARLVVRGFNQIEGLDYQELFAPVARMDTIRVLLAVCASKHLKLRQFDITTAFLYGNLDEEIYVTQPPGFEDNTKRVCLLHKSLYGLKQAPRCFHKTLANELTKLNFIQSQADNCLYQWHGENGEFLYLTIYVDDGLLAATSDQLIDDTLAKLAKIFELKSAPLTLFLGIHIHVDERQNIWLNQFKYIRGLLKRYNMEACRPTTIPGDSGIYSLPDRPTPEVIDRPYRSLIGGLLWIAICTRPDLAFIVGFLARYLDKYTEHHWQAALRVLRYLHKTSDLSLVYSGDSETPLEDTLRLYSDADFAACKETRRSVSGSLVQLAGGAILWSSQQQKCVSLSSTEAEYIALSECTKTALWLRTLFEELNINTKPVILVDNQSSLRLIHNSEYHKRTEHIATRFLFCRQVAEQQQVEYKYVSTTENLADALTKALSKPTFERLRQLINLQPWPVKQTFS